MNKVEGTYQNLSNKYDFNTIDYIIANPSFKAYLDGDKSLEGTTYHVVYEDEKCLLKEFKAKNKTLVKSSNNL